MKFRNYIQNLLPIAKPDQWIHWKSFSEKNNFLFSLIEEESERPILRGFIGGRSLSIEAEKGLDDTFHIKVVFLVNNFKDYYILLEDKKIIDSSLGIFSKKISGFSKQKDFEEKFLIRSNSETFSMKLFKEVGLLELLNQLDLHSIEIQNYECKIKSYAKSDIGTDFVRDLKIYYEFLSRFDEIYLQNIQL